mmetsp:Transcript_37112/g.83571  ORF Transcript_37112/g.83571 Transcript_37112/m.83571 type:complete len:528 (-) Transcript_37112:15-1598(-)
MLLHHWRILLPLITTDLRVSAFSFSTTARASRGKFECQFPKHHPLRATKQISEETSSSSQSEEQRISVHETIEKLTRHPAVYWDETTTFSSLHNKKLKMRHIDLFAETSDEDYRLFNGFARAVAQAGRVARKEVFETWASALHIHSGFLQGEGAAGLRRVCDVAAGHGLLAWALLILDDAESKSCEGEGCRPLTVLCLDVVMPRNAELIQVAMLECFPHLESRFDYVEGRLEQLIPHPSCLLASVHACGPLSDVLVATSASSGVPLAVVPCCHSRKRKVLEPVASPFAWDLYDEIMSEDGSMPDLADRLDHARVTALRNSGMVTEEEFLPTLFTDKNRLILARVPDDGSFQSSKPQGQAKVKKPKRQRRKGSMPPLDESTSTKSINPNAKYLRGFSVPCEDSETRRALVSRQAGREAADSRKAMMHNRNHSASPRLNMSLWLPENEGALSEEALADLINSRHDGVAVEVSKVGEIYTNSEGRRSQSYRFEYASLEGGKSILKFDDAKRLHRELYELVPKAFIGAECR